MLGAMFAIQQSEKKSPPRDFLALDCCIQDAPSFSADTSKLDAPPCRV